MVGDLNFLATIFWNGKNWAVEFRTTKGRLINRNVTNLDHAVQTVKELIECVDWAEGGR